MLEKKQLFYQFSSVSSSRSQTFPELFPHYQVCTVFFIAWQKIENKLTGSSFLSDWILVSESDNRVDWHFFPEYIKEKSVEFCVYLVVLEQVEQVGRRGLVEKESLKEIVATPSLWSMMPGELFGLDWKVGSQRIVFRFFGEGDFQPPDSSAKNAIE